MNRPDEAPAYLAAWLKLLTRSPADIEAGRQARKPAPRPPVAARHKERKP